MAQWTNLQWTEKFENPARLYINCEKSGGLYLAEPGLTAGWPASWQMKFGRGLRFKMLAADRNTRFFTLFSQGTALFQKLLCIANIFLDKYCYKVVLWSVNVCEAL